MQINQLLKLSVRERIAIIEKLWESIDHNDVPVTNAQKKELDNRLSRIDKGEEKFSSWEDVKERLHKSKK